MVWVVFILNEKNVCYILYNLFELVKIVVPDLKKGKLSVVLLGVNWV